MILEFLALFVGLFLSYTLLLWVRYGEIEVENIAAVAAHILWALCWSFLITRWIG